MTSRDATMVGADWKNLDFCYSQIAGKDIPRSLLSRSLYRRLRLDCHLFMTSIYWKIYTK